MLGDHRLGGDVAHRARQVLSLRERQFVERAQALGASHVWIMRRHILPNVMPLVWANSVLIVALSILGRGDALVLRPRRPDASSWGTMLYNGFQAGAVNQGAWWYFVPPGLCITLFVLGFFAVGQAIEEIVNPRLRERR